MTEKHDIVHIDESDRGACYYCGRPAAIKVGMWSDLTSTEEDTEQSWRAVLICKDCNDKHRWVDEQGLPDTYLGY
jgi:5-methylcytosine-specific restriction endonuclease McrA